MACVGICGSDVHYLDNGRIGDFVVNKPMILGHEASGTIIKLGKNVTNLELGDRVAIEPGVPCRYCKFCKTGRYNLCKDVQFCATPPVDGSLRHYYKHAADFCFKLPANVSLEEGALMEPLSVGVHACKRAGVGLGSTVLILGAGPVGLLTVTAAKSMGAKTVVICDIMEYRLNVAKTLGADVTYIIRTDFDETQNSKAIHELLNDEPDVSIDATGFESSVRLAIAATKPGGKAVFVGMGAAEVKIPYITAVTKEIDMITVFRYANDYSDALDIIANSKTNIRGIITHRFKLEETVEAFITSKTNKTNAIKVMINCD